jgi:hypothetical protein
MNIFILSENPVEAASMLCDKHAGGKMVVESAQMLSTAHRMLDGMLTRGPSKSGKTISKKWIHPDEEMDRVLYKAVHMSHPCTIWTMTSSSNYEWHYEYYIALCKEYTYRYGKIHSTDKLLTEYLKHIPKNIKHGPRTQFPLAMKSNPECMFPDDPVKSYRMFYQTKQNRFKMVWTKRSVPEWFKQREPF